MMLPYSFKDCYPLPIIDQLVDSNSGHALLSFMDFFSGYNHIILLEADRKKTTFITDSGVYNYKATPFGLRNAGATYQKLVDKVFADHKGRNIEVYVDDSTPFVCLFSPLGFFLNEYIKIH